MADKSKDKDNKANSAFTPREQEVMAMAWQCFEGEPKVNYKKLASLLGMENPVSASNAWSRIKKKLAAQASDVATAGDGGEGVDSPMKATPKKRTPKHKKAAAAKDGEDGNDEEGNGSPSKKTKTPKSGGKGKKVKEEVVEEGNVTDGEVKMEEGEDSAFV